MRLYIVSGTSGSGKSVVLHALEDLGLYCIDNLPLELLPPFAEHLRGVGSPAFQDAAVAVDARNLTSDFSRFPDILAHLEGQGLECHTLFLDAADDSLIKRFSETRRRHPLTDGEVPLAEAIRLERGLLEPISSQAEFRIDTGRTNVHQLRELILSRIQHATGRGMSVLFQSFGYKHGVPVDADFVFDVRCLPNPHWETRLQPLTGLDAKVVTFLEEQPTVDEMYRDIQGFLAHWLPRFEADNRSYLTVAIGCTGGRHRSVYFVERLARSFGEHRNNVLTRHRELS
ncbi:MAG TPA: RNase adapter RapZ [Gammaproteobacteria bacterium]|nr:RNase adapter RapZ [Gammaproteobacteria bacterium]